MPKNRQKTKKKTICLIVTNRQLMSRNLVLVPETSFLVDDRAFFFFPAPFSPEILPVLLRRPDSDGKMLWPKISVIFSYRLVTEYKRIQKWQANYPRPNPYFQTFSGHATREEKFLQVPVPAASASKLTQRVCLYVFFQFS